MRSQTKKADFPDQRLSSVDDGMVGDRPIPGCPVSRNAWTKLVFAFKAARSVSSYSARTKIREVPPDNTTGAVSGMFTAM